MICAAVRIGVSNVVCESEARTTAVPESDRDPARRVDAELRLKTRNDDLPDAKCGEPLVQIRALKRAAVTFPDHGLSGYRSRGGVKPPSRCSPGEGLSRIVLMLHVKDGCPLRPGSPQQHGNPPQDGVAIMSRRARQSEHSLLDIDYDQSGRHGLESRA
jgi:hypothetical protein